MARATPDGLSGREIPLEARIICLADSVQAMESDRPYRNALSKGEILAEINKHAGTQFDPIIVKAFLKVMQKGSPVMVKTLTQEPDTFIPVFSNPETAPKREVVSVEMNPQKVSI